MPVKIVDDDGMAVVVSPVLAQVRVIGGQVGMAVGQGVRLVCRPDPDREGDAKCGDERHREEGRVEAECHPEPPRQGIGEKPAGMAEGELRGEEGGPILGL